MKKLMITLSMSAMLLLSTIQVAVAAPQSTAPVPASTITAAATTAYVCPNGNEICNRNGFCPGDGICQNAICSTTDGSAYVCPNNNEACIRNGFCPQDGQCPYDGQCHTDGVCPRASGQRQGHGHHGRGRHCR
ncbi:MAG: hypothetical protein RSF83_09835 [Hungatella sp.]